MSALLFVALLLPEAPGAAPPPRDPAALVSRGRMKAAGVKPRELPPEDHPRIAAALLIGTLPGVKLDDAGWDRLTLPLCYHVAFRREAARQDARGERVRELLGRWCLTARSDWARWNALWHVLAHRLAGPGRELARRVLAQSKSPMAVAGAACVLGHHGEAEDIPRLLPLLKRTEEYHPVSKGIQVADVALEALARLTGQNPRDYGVTKPTPLFTMPRDFSDGRGTFTALIPCYPVATFQQAADREAAFRRWAEWAKKNPQRLVSRS